MKEEEEEDSTATGDRVGTTKEMKVGDGTNGVEVEVGHQGVDETALPGDIDSEDTAEKGKDANAEAGAGIAIATAAAVVVVAAAAAAATMTKRVTMM